MNSIDVSGPMAAVFQNGAGEYQPIIPGVELGIECGQTVPTLKNLDAILAAGHEIAVFLLGNGRVLVCFTNGNQYLATGFSYGHSGQEVRQFAAFASKHGFGDFKILFSDLSSLSKEHSGVMTRAGCDDDAIDSDMVKFKGDEILDRARIY